MMAEHDESQELSEEQQLQDRLERICLDYQTLVNIGRKMAPKGTNAKKTDPTTENSVEDDDFEEISNVADNLDSLESALGLIEERADRILEQLLQLLTSNREIRQSLQEENDKLLEETKDESDANSSSTPENTENNEQ